MQEKLENKNHYILPDFRSRFLFGFVMKSANGFANVITWISWLFHQVWLVGIILGEKMGYYDYVNKNQHDSRKANFLYAVNSLGPSIIKTYHKNEVDEKWRKWEIHAHFSFQGRFEDKIWVFYYKNVKFRHQIMQIMYRLDYCLQFSLT